MRLTVDRRVLALALPLLLPACGRRGGSAAVPPPPPPPTPFPPPTRIYYDNSGGIQDSLRLVLKEAGDFATIWQQATSRQTSPPPAPAVDFAAEMLIVVGAGRMRPDDQIAVDSVYRTRELDTSGRMVETLPEAAVALPAASRASKSRRLREDPDVLLRLPHSHTSANLPQHGRQISSDGSRSGDGSGGV